MTKKKNKYSLNLIPDLPLLRTSRMVTYALDTIDLQRHGVIVCNPEVAQWLREQLNPHRIVSEAHKAAARENGKKGGAPTKNQNARKTTSEKP